MSKNLYIDATHPNETRVVLKKDNHIEDYEYESVNNTLIKNNIYLGKVSRIEPSLQAAFVDFGRERHGFLSFNDIQSDYYQLPHSDLEKIKEEEEKVREELSKESENNENKILEGNNEITINDPVEKLEDEIKEKSNNQKNDLLKIAALLIHAAKIDENFTIEEEKIIEETLLNLGANKDNVKQIIIESKKIEDKANQI